MKLKTKFILNVSVFVAIFSLIAFLALSNYKKSMKETIAQQQFLMTSALADEFDSNLLTAQQNLVAVAKAAPPDIMQHSEEAQVFIDNRPSLHSIFDNHVFLYTPAGKLFVESPYAPGRRGLDFSFREYIPNTLKAKKPYISDPFLSSQRHNHPVITLTVPLFDAKGRLTGILAGSIDLMRENFLGKLSTVKIGEGGYFYLMALDGTLIMHPDKKRILTKITGGVNRLQDKAIGGFEGTDETITGYGTKMLASFKRLKAKNWILIANYPQAEAYRPIQVAERYLLVATITGIIVIFLIISFIINYLITPLELFTRHVEHLPQKTGDDRFLDIKTKDEIGTLSRAFNKMVNEIDKRSELERSEELYRTVIEFSTDFVYWRAPDNKIIYVSENCEKFCGYTEEEFYASPELLETMIYPDDQTIWAEHTRDIHNKGITKHLELRMVTKGGEVRWISHNCLPVYDKKGKYRGRRASHRDITEQKKLQEQLLHSQKMEAIGVLAGGVAHDFNNVLTAIVGYGGLAQMRIKGDPTTEGYIQQVLDAADRAGGLTKSLLAFSRKQVIEPVLADLNEIVRNIEKMVRRIITEDIEVSTVLSAEELPVMVDVGQIEQVLMNFAVNARDAMPDGGQLVIQTDTVDVDSSYAKTHVFENTGMHAVLTVSDTGIGMDQETKENIFEPFFTTKEVGKGTGLGLSMVYGIIKQHNGSINVYSELGKGTTFRIYLPLAQKKGEIIPKPVETFPPGKGETIIIAEDEPMVRESMKLRLQETGYRIIEAENGEDAVRKFKENRGSVSLVILDVIMPVKNGREAYEEIRGIEPDVKTIFMSGYTDDIISRKGILEEGFDFISKPVNPVILMRKIRDVLDRQQHLPG